MQRIKAYIEKIKNREQGAIVAEATIALTTFVFISQQVTSKLKYPLFKRVL